MHIYFFILFFLASAGFLAAAEPLAVKAVEPPRAAYLDVPEQPVAPGSEFPVRVFVNADEATNAVSTVVSYSPDALEYLGARTGGSLIEYWTSDPMRAAGGKVILEGGFGAPFAGENGFLAELLFRAVGTGDAAFSFEKIELYRADGEGTRYMPTGTPVFLLRVAEDGARLSLEAANDTAPPVFRALRIAENPIEGSRNIVFQAVDHESGVREVFIKTREWFSWGEWRNVSNPARLGPGAWAARVRAIDAAGNEAAETLFIQSVIFKKIFSVFGIFVLIAVSFVWIRRLAKRFRGATIQK